VVDGYKALAGMQEARCSKAAQTRAEQLFRPYDFSMTPSAVAAAE
jgi:hypothetical protein